MLNIKHSEIYLLIINIEKNMCKKIYSQTEQKTTTDMFKTNKNKHG